MRPRLRMILTLGLAATALVPRAARARDPDDEPASPTAWASMWIEPGRPTRFQFVGQMCDTAVTAAIGRIAGRAPQTSEFATDWTQWTVELPIPLRTGLALREDIRLDPLLQVLRAHRVRTLTLLVQHPPVGYVTLGGAASVPVDRFRFSVALATDAPAALSLELGWSARDVARSAAVLLLTLITPILVALALRRRSIARDRTPEQWLFRAKANELITILGWALWAAVVEATRVADLVEFALRRPGWPPVIAAPLWMLAYLPTSLVITVITRREVQRLRGFDPLPGGAARLRMLRTISLLMLVILGVAAFAAGDPRCGVAAMLTCVVGSVLWQPPRGPLGTTLQSLSSGALRDRLFDLARRAGVKLRGLYVVPMRSARMANAFAVQGGSVMVADELLDRMSRREVDAVLAHEISHLEHHHPLKTWLAGLGVLLSIVTVTEMRNVPFGPAAALLVFWFALRFVARRFEFAADAGGAALSGDPEALISGLGRLGRLNDVPLAWGRRWAWLVTHPTTEARAQAIGRRAGLAPGRVAELLATGLAVESRYGDRERPGEGPRVFSTAWKAATSSRLGLATLAAAVLAPAVALAAARAVGIHPPVLVAIVAGAVLALLATLAVFDNLGARAVAGLETALRRRLPADDARGVVERFVTLSPGDRPRVYEGFLDWDLGLLEIGPHHIGYRGEQVTLRVPRAAVLAVEVGAAAPGWIPAPRVIVRWLGPTGEQAVSLRAADSRMVSGIGPASRALAGLLESWRRDASAPEAGAAPAGIGPVTARTLAEVSAPRDLPLLLALLALFAAATSFTLRFDLWQGLQLFAGALVGVIAMRWPAMTSREPRSATATTPEPQDRAA